jgi:hypothetical protein
MGDLQQASPIPANVPKGIVTEWDVEDVRNWLSQSMQLPQYLNQFEGIFSPSEAPASIIYSEKSGFGWIYPPSVFQGVHADFVCAFRK